MRVEVIGARSVEDVLAALPPEFTEVVSESITVGTLTILAEAHARVPVGGPASRDPHPGVLKASLHAELRDDGLHGRVSAGGKQGGGDAYYARFVEFGTVHRPAQPFLYPAFKIGARYVRRQIDEWVADVAAKLRYKVRRPYKGPDRAKALARASRRARNAAAKAAK